MRGWCWLVLFVALGCTGGEALQPKLEAQQFPLAFVHAGCARAETCCAGHWGTMSAADARARCEAMDEFSAALMGDLDGAVKAGHATYDGPNAEKCVQTIETVSCDLRIDITRVDMAGVDCMRAVHGHVDVGGDCDSSWDCAPGLFCDVIPQATARCVSRRPNGAPCASEAQCSSGRCVNNLCDEQQPLCSDPSWDTTPRH